ncbi:MAG: hypothetical protein GWP08_12540 [Nitrospiraceae bacterium]|nr:hypothetical protein [Nitrospiraceae bacterium]
MNPDVTTQLKRITGILAELEDEVAERDTQLADVTRTRDRLRQESWKHAKQVRVLEERLADYPELKRQNEHFRAQTDEFERRLQRILSYTRSLAGEIRS